MVLGTINVMLVAQNANSHSLPWDCGKSDGAREALVPLWIIILQSNLEFNGRDKGAFLGLGILEKSCMTWMRGK
jgi:hypothetical protein